MAKIDLRHNQDDTDLAAQREANRIRRMKRGFRRDDERAQQAATREIELLKNRSLVIGDPWSYGNTNRFSNFLTDYGISLLGSWGLRWNFDVRPIWGVKSGSCDFADHTIRVYFDHASVPKYDPATGEFIGTDPDGGTMGRRGTEEMTEELYGLLGLLCHEMGHVVYTVPFEQLKKMYEWECPLGGGFPMMSNGMHEAWNILEDQRMEMAMINESPVMGSHIMTNVLQTLKQIPAENVHTIWPHLIGRTWLPNDVRWHFYESYVNTTGFGTYGSWEVEGDDGTMRNVRDAVEWASIGADIVQEYMEASGPITMAHAVIKFSKWYNRHTGDLTDTSQAEVSTTRPSLDDRRAEEPMRPNENLEKMQKSAQPLDGEQDLTPTPAAKNDPEATPQQKQTAIEKAIDDDEDLSKALQPGKSQRQEFTQQACRSVGGDDTVAAAGSVQVMSTDDVAEAKLLAAPLTEALRVRIGHAAPQWRQRQTTGILNPVQYRTRRPGDREYRRNYADNGNPGSDLAVTLLLDSSISMDGEGVRNCGIVGLAAGMACEEVGVRYEAISWNTDYGTIHAHDAELREVYPRSEGGTEPSKALDYVWRADIPQQHLVILMTDGEFSPTFNRKGFEQWVWDDNVHLIGLEYNKKGEAIEKNNWGNVDHHVITDLAEIPLLVQKFIQENLPV